MAVIFLSLHLLLIQHHTTVKKGSIQPCFKGVVDAKCRFWDYDSGWSGRSHDWALFQRTDIGKRVIKLACLPYKLIGDVAYPMRPWFYSPFKGEKDGLP